MSRWFSGAKSERGESSGSGRRQGHDAPTPATPAAFAANVPRRVQVVRPTAPALTPHQAPAAPGTRRTRRRRYVPEPECQWHWDNATPGAVDGRPPAGRGVIRLKRIYNF